MDKMIFQDVTPPSRRSIRSIPLSKERQVKVEFKRAREEKPVKRRLVRKPGMIFRRFFRYFLAFLAIVVVGIAVFGVMSFFSFSEIAIFPKVEIMEVNVVLESEKDNALVPLSHMIVMSSTTKTIAVEANKEKAFDERAKGTIVIFNNYSSADQRLIKNTRFETTDGRIYRIDSSVVVPGQRDVNGVKTPGSVEAFVYADLAGAEYNLKATGASPLSVPGFKGTPRFDYFYAELKTDIAGGFSGTRKYLEDSVATQVKESLKNDIRGELEPKLKASIPAGYFLIPDGQFIEYYENPETISNDKVVVSMSGISYAIVVDKKELSTAVAKTAMEDYDGKVLEIHNLNDLTISIADPTNKLWLANSLAIKVSGNAQFVWSIDTEGVISAIVGKPKTEIKTILGIYDEIDKAEITLKPFWLSSFPSNREKIKLNVVIDAE